MMRRALEHPRWPSRLSAGLLAVVCVLIVAGCGPDGNAKAASASASASASGSSVLIWSDPEHAPALRASATAHEQATGVAVVVEAVGAELGDMAAQIRDLAPQGKGPDLFVGRSEWVGSLAESGLLGPVAAGGPISSFRDVAVAGFNYDGRQYGVPFATDNLALLRNTDLAEGTPSSIEEMARSGLALAKEKRNVLPIAVPVGQGGDAYHWFPFYSAAGGAIFGLDSHGGYTAEEVEVGQPGSVEAARQWAELTEEEAVSRNTTSAKALKAFTSGRSPYLVAGPSVIETVEQSGVPFVVEAIPGFDDVLASRSRALVSSLGILPSAFGRNPAGAQQYLATTLVTTDVMTELAQPGGLGPAWQPSYDFVAEEDPVVGGFGEYADSSVPIPNLPQTEAVWPILGSAQVDVMSGDSPADTMKAAGRAIQDLVDES